MLVPSNRALITRESGTTDINYTSFLDLDQIKREEIVKVAFIACVIL